MKSQFTRERAKKFLSYYKPYRRIFMMDMFFAALSACSVLLFPLVSGYMTEEVLTNWDSGAKNKLILTAAVLVLLTAIKVVSNIIYAYFGHAMGAKMEEAMRLELFEHYEALSFGFHAGNSTGRLMTVLSNDLNNMTELFHHAPEDLLAALIKFIGAFAIMLSIHVPLTLLVFLALPFLGIAAYYTDQRMEKYLLKSRRDLSQLNEYAEDTLSGIRTVKAFGNEGEHARNFQEKNQRYTAGRCIFYKVEAYFYETVESYPQFLSMLVVIFGSFFIAEGKAGFIRFMDMLEITPAVAEKTDAVSLKHAKGSISFDQVSFHYEDSKEDVLQNISFHIESGQTIAFAGASGIGKTTIASLTARFYDVCSGCIRIDGIIHEFILSLENGYDSLVGTKGIMLSGGQRQRISIARLFLKNPRILIMDEATSALDYESEEAVQKSIEKLKENRTSIFIAHRLSTVRNADQIFVLADRHIVEQGTHDELTARNGVYAKLSRIGSM